MRKKSKTYSVLKLFDEIEKLTPEEKRFFLHTKPKYIKQVIRRIEVLKNALSKKQIVNHKHKISQFNKRIDKVRILAQREIARTIFKFIKSYIPDEYEEMSYIIISSSGYLKSLDYFISIEISLLNKHNLLDKVLKIEYDELKNTHTVAREIAKHISNHLDEEYLQELEFYLEEIKRPNIVYIIPPPRKASIKKENLAILNKNHKINYSDKDMEYLKYKDYSDYKKKELKYLGQHWNAYFPFYIFSILEPKGVKDELKISRKFNEDKLIRFYSKILRKLKKVPYCFNEDNFTYIYANNIDLKTMKSIVLDIFKRHKISSIREKDFCFHLDIRFDEI